MSQSKKKTILINASAAKTGGALTILETFLENIPQDDRNYIVLSPYTEIIKKDNILYIKKTTDKVNTVLFSFIGITFFILKYKPEFIISFNNINYIFSNKKGITYFHQPKALIKGYKEVKIAMYDLIIKFFLKKNKFIVQSNEVKRLFIKKYNKIDSSNVISCWPGFKIPLHKNENGILKTIKIKNNDFLGILPIAYNAEHKNLKLLVNLIPFFKMKNIKIITLMDDDFSLFIDKEVFINIGQVTRNELFSIYEKVNFLIFTSKDETVGLPIFEFMQTGKPAFVYEADYAIGFYKQFNKPKNLVLFESSDGFINQFGEKISIMDNKIDYSKGEWQKIMDII